MNSRYNLLARYSIGIVQEPSGSFRITVKKYHLLIFWRSTLSFVVDSISVGPEGFRFGAVNPMIVANKLGALLNLAVEEKIPVVVKIKMALTGSVRSHRLQSQIKVGGRDGLLT